MNEPSASGAPPESGLKRQLGFGSAAAVIAGQTIAVGIFLTPAGMARSLGSPFWLLVVWSVSGLMTVCGALCYGALAVRFPQTGGTYIYLKNIYGPRIAFLYGWMCLVVMDPGLCSVLAIGFASYLGYMLPLSPLAMKAVAIAAIVVIGTLNILGTRLSALVVNLVTAGKVLVLLVLPVWAVLTKSGDWSNFLPFVAQRSGSQSLLGALAGAFVAAFFSFGGWWEVTRIAGEVRDPARNLPRALIAGVFTVLFVYLAVSAVFLYVVPLQRVTDDRTFVAQMGEALFGAAGGRVLAGIVVLSVISSLAAFMMAVPRVYFAMAQDGVFLPAAAQVSRRFGTPARAIALQMALASVLVLLGTFDQIIAYFIFVAVLFLGLAAAGVFKLEARGFGYPFAPAIFLALIALLLVLLVAGRPREAALGTLITAAGAPLYALRRRT